jgi:hypothetical protein
MWYNDTVRILKLTITAIVAIPAFLALQIVSRPLMLCLAGSCEMVQCDLTETELQSVCVPVDTDFMPSGCGRMAEKETASPCGGCGQPEDPPAQAGCCGDSELAESPCAGPDGCDVPASECPGPFAECAPCLPITMVAEASQDLTIRITDYTDYPPAQASTRALAEADRERGLLHAHSPPCVLPARAGPQICIENCSFLI